MLMKQDKDVCHYCRRPLAQCRCKRRAWAATFVLGSLLFTGCGVLEDWNPVAATTDDETFIVAETARFSGMTSQRVHGEISTYLYTIQSCPDGIPSPCHAFGWYVGDYGKGAKGVAYYYQPDISRYNRPILTGVAAHEVCHSVTGPEHDPALSACIAKNNVVTSASFICLTPIMAREHEKMLK
jgi:hypothetical protein